MNSNLNASAALDQETGNPRKPVTPPPCSQGFKLGICSKPPVGIPNALLCLANNCAITQVGRQIHFTLSLCSAAAQQNVAEESPSQPEDGTWSTDKIHQPAFVPKVAQALPLTWPAVTEPLAAFVEPQTFSTMMARFNKLYKRRYGFGLEWL